jgi:NADH-quinone oxidoreductase subunit L
MTGEVEDTDVGFPGPEHHIAEREGTMKVAMGVLAIGATLAGLVQIPAVTHVVDSFLEPSFADSRYFDKLHASDSFAYFGLAVGAVVGLVGVGLAWLVWVRRPGTAAVIRARFAPVHRLFVNKWYWDELIDAAFVRPAVAVGRFSQQTFERVVVNGLFVGGTTGVVRAGSAAVRAVQTGLLRYYAALLLLGLGGLALYFLVSST